MKTKLLALILFLLIGGSAHAVVSNTVPQTSIACNGVATTFQYTFPIIDTTHATDLYVYTQTGGVQTQLTTNYSVNTSTSTVTYPVSGSACALGTSIIMSRVEPLTQNVLSSYQGTGVTPPVMSIADKLTMITQQLQNNINNVTLTANSAASQTTTTIYIDTNNTNSYTPTGSINYPYKATGGVGAIQNALTAIGTPATSIAIYLAPGTYIESNLTFPNVQVSLYGNGAEIVTGLGAGNGTLTFPNEMNIDNVTIVGSLNSTWISTSGGSTINRSTILGNLTVYANVLGSNNIILGTGSSNGLITIEPNALFNLSVTTIGLPFAGLYSRILNEGTLLLDDSQIFTNDNSNYAIDSSTSGSNLDLSLVRVYQYGTGTNCGITMAGNGAIPNVNPNSIGHTYIFCAGLTNGIVAGSSAALLDGYVLTYTFNTSPTVGYASGTNISARNYQNITTSAINGFSTIPLVLSSGFGQNIGIGSSYPGAFLDIQGTVRFYNGNIGIGTPSPGQALDVGGTLRIRDIGIGTTVPELVCRKSDGTFGTTHGSTFGGTCN